jgi:hypothetical protein
VNATDTPDITCPACNGLASGTDVRACAACRGVGVVAYPAGQPDDGRPTRAQALASRAYRGCPLGAHLPGEPHHYTCWAWFG